MSYKRISGMPVNEGGTGQISLTTAYGVLCAGTTATGVVQTISSLGSSGNVLTSQGAGSLPQWSAPASGGVPSIAGTTNQITESGSPGATTLSIPSTFIAPGTIASTTTLAAGTNLLMPTTTSTVGSIIWDNAGTYPVYMHTYGTDFTGGLNMNFFVTQYHQNFSYTGSNNIVIGSDSGRSLTSGTDNVGLGFGIFNSGAQTGSYNVGICNSALQTIAGATGNIGIGYNSLTVVNAGNYNTAVGYNTLAAVNASSSTFSYNTAIGYNAGSSVTNTAAASNIYINSHGAANESNTLRLGQATGSSTQNLSAAYICGIYSESNSGTQNLCVIDSNDKLGSSTSTSVTGSLTMSTFIEASTVFNTPTTSATVGQYQINGSAVLHTFGTGNLFVGVQGSTLSVSGTSNTGIGRGALFALTSGTDNTAVGADALDTFTTGSHNTAIGSGAGQSLTVGDHDNILIGYNVGGTAGDTYTLRVGNGTGSSAGNLNKAFVAGIQGITVTGSAVLVSSSDQLGVAVSSKRYKENIQDLGYSDVLTLRPVSFNYNIGDDHSTQTGLIAEEVAEIMPQLVVYDKEGLPAAVKYHDLPVLLLHEIQKMAKRIEQLEGVINGSK